MGLVEASQDNIFYKDLIRRSGRGLFELPQQTALKSDGNFQPVVEENLQQAQIKSQEALKKQALREQMIAQGTEALTSCLDGVTSLTLFDHKRGEYRDIFAGIPAQVSKRTKATPQDLASRRAKRLMGLYKRGNVSMTDVEQAVLQLPIVEGEEGQGKVDGLMGELWATGFNNKALQKERRALRACQTQVKLWQTWRDYYQHQYQIDSGLEALCCQLRETNFRLFSCAQLEVQVATQRGHLNGWFYSPILAELKERRASLLTQLKEKSELVPSEVLRIYLSPQSFGEILGQQKLTEWVGSVSSSKYRDQEEAVLKTLQEEAVRDSTTLARLRKKRGVKTILKQPLLEAALARHQQLMKEETVKQRQQTDESVWNKVSEYRKASLIAKESTPQTSFVNLKKLMVSQAQKPFQALGGLIKDVAGIFKRPSHQREPQIIFPTQGTLDFRPQVRT